MFRDWCKKCEFPRYIEGYEGPADYIANGWVRFVTTTTREDSVRGIIPDGETIEWLCPACAEAIEAERQALMDIGSTQVNRRGVMVSERST